MISNLFMLWCFIIFKDSCFPFTILFDNKKLRMKVINKEVG